MRVLQQADSELRKHLRSQKICPGTKYKPSQYVLRFTHAGRRFLFHTLTRELLEACACLAQSSRFGNVLNGITNEDARRSFCSVDRIREKCRKCPFLPECTAFDSCPYNDTHCRDVREMDELAVLKDIVKTEMMA